jgi:tetratricopeptide (TPR) repeat protein
MPPTEGTAALGPNLSIAQTRSGWRWPGWFDIFDKVLALLALGLVFFLASFPARNSDVWLHLASGKRMLAGEYFPGGHDPFSYTASDRVWVHHSWLFDIVAYLAYSAHKYGLVLFKVALITMAFGLLLLLRRAGFSLWPWVVCLVVAAVAAAPQFVLRSSVASLLFLSLTVVLLLRGGQVNSRSWRWPMSVALVFWLWAMCDQWFFLGPVVILLAGLGEWVQRYWQRGESSVSPTTSQPEAHVPSGENVADALGTLPPPSVLLKAFILGLIACTLTPLHVRVWELPVELTGAQIQDPRLEQLFLSPLDRIYYGNSSFGRNVNGLAYAVLLVGGGALLAFGVGRLQLAHVTLWLGMAALSFQSLYVIPFFALVAVPLMAGQLNQLSSRVRLISWDDVRSRLVLLSSVVGRWASLVGVLVALACAWPGWLHPTPGHPSGRRHVGWTVDPDPALVRVAQRLQQWREEGKLSQEARGFLASPELANYCAWFAPSEKVFINSRYTHHKAELSVLAAVRGALGLHLRGELLGSDELSRQLAPWKVEYLGVHFTVIESRRQPELSALVQQLLWQDDEHFALWYLDGRTTLGGWRNKVDQERPSFNQLKLDVVEQAFGAGVTRLPPLAVRDVPPRLGWEADFLRNSRWPSPAIDEAFAWAQYSRLLEERHRQRLLAVQMTLQAVDHILGGSGWLLELTPTWPASAEQLAIPFLALRAARRAQAEDPDDPDTYAALAEALSLPRLPLSADERSVSRVTALRQCLARMPSPSEYTFGTYHAHPTKIAAQLASLYLGERQPAGYFTGLPVNLPAFHILRRIGATGTAIIRGGQVVEHTPTVTLLAMDLARDTLRLAKSYLDYDDRAFGENTPKIAQELTNFLKQVEEETQRLENLYEREKLRLPAQGKVALAQLGLALRHNLVGEALRLLEDEQWQASAELGAAAAEIEFARIVLLTAIGRLEDAATALEVAASRFDAVVSLREPLRWLRYQMAVVAGDYAEAGAILEDFAAVNIGQDPPLPKRGEILGQFPGIPWIARPDGQPFHYDLLEAQVLTAWLRPQLLDKLVQGQLLTAIQAPYNHYRQQLILRRVSDAEYFWRRGYLYLVEGDILRARQCLEQARRTGVPQWNVPEYSHATAEEYRRLMERIRHP